MAKSEGRLTTGSAGVVIDSELNPLDIGKPPVCKSYVDLCQGWWKAVEAVRRAPERTDALYLDKFPEKACSKSAGYLRAGSFDLAGPPCAFFFHPHCSARSSSIFRPPIASLQVSALAYELVTAICTLGPFTSNSDLTAGALAVVSGEFWD